eukprot:CAMPEP_0184679208 /NCGR_PEP_ID=MMETSP0312-20130426/2032_1 /TAXON_ID=31354 /ORGANISM="Compsopogon coeruleus, Strain SAG 36.94" /LENGTH=186 /DNA_ID=CAMNT_0027128503 /DNA_START=537 /DNA_END=1098 /DNA_ORIENTATION=+
MEKNFCIDLFNFPIEGGKEISLPAQVSPQQMNFCLDLCNVPTEGGQEFSLPGQVSQQQMCFCLDLCNVPMEGGKEFSLPASLIVESQLEDGYWQPLIRERVDQDIKAGRKIKERRFACGHNGCSAKFSKKFNLRATKGSTPVRNPMFAEPKVVVSDFGGDRDSAAIQRSYMDVSGLNPDQFKSWNP